MNLRSVGFEKSVEFEKCVCVDDARERVAGGQGRNRERGGSTSTGLYVCPECVSFCARARAKC